MDNFVPTYLYIKQHSETGKKYFGKTIKKDPLKYLGSGLRWRRHILAHGKQHVVTIWSRLFTDKKSLIEYATNFSETEHIVESEEWLNLVPENGTRGSGRFGPLSLETKAKISAANKGKPYDGISEEGRKKIAAANRGRIRSNISDETRQLMSLSHLGKLLGPRSQEIKNKISSAQKDRPQKLSTCPHCEISGGRTVMKRWHFDRCKNNSQEK